tara:strand:- start:365 stop:619 length:255 start_codon:yes stop_codon:yes gene_type:complete
MHLTNSQLDFIRTEITNHVLDQMSDKEKRCYLFQVIYNKYATMRSEELLTECKNVLDGDTMLGIETALRFQQWLDDKYEFDQAQ